jgi:glycosyltransferase involved in cell wall biosynthesis
MKVLLVSMYFPPAGGGGVQRPLKIATHLPSFGIETHVLAPDDPKWVHRDDELEPPTQAWVHRARYVGPRGRVPSEELYGKNTPERLAYQARSLARRALVPDENVVWNATAIPAALRIVRRERIDVVITTSPPNSVHLIGAAAKRVLGVNWVADLRDPLIGDPHRRPEHLAARAKERVHGAVARLVAGQADAIVAAWEQIAEEVRELEPKGRVAVIPNGCDFDDFDGLEYHPGERFRITYAGSFWARDPRPFLEALRQTDGVVARFVGDFPAPAREFAERHGLHEKLELLGYVPRRRALELQRDSEALLLLLPHEGERTNGWLPGKIFEYLAAERPVLAAVPPNGAAARLIREAHAGVVVAPADVRGMRDALNGLATRWHAGALDGTPLEPKLKERLSRRKRVEELANLLLSL